MEKKKEGKNSLTVIVVLVILLVCALGSTAYFYLESEKTSDKETTVTKSDKVEVNASNFKNAVSPFDNKKALNSSVSEYLIADFGPNGINAQVDTTQKVLTFSYIPSKAVEAYGLNWTSNRTDRVSSTINFDKKIVEVLFGGMGQDAQGDTLFILLEDGTVEYIPIVHMFNNAQDRPVSYGKISGVDEVIKLSNAETSNGVTTLAVKLDGTFYDLWYALKDTGNY